MSNTTSKMIETMIEKLENRINMINKVVRKYGVETSESIGFCQVAEDWKNSDEYVNRLYFLLMGAEV